jgi:hypothetical protein
MILALSFGESVVNHFARRCMSVSYNTSTRSKNILQLCPALKAGSSSFLIISNVFRKGRLYLLDSHSPNFAGSSDCGSVTKDASEDFG